jgi:hypothetical protein
MLLLLLRAGGTVIDVEIMAGKRQIATEKEREREREADSDGERKRERGDCVETKLST